MSCLFIIPGSSQLGGPLKFSDGYDSDIEGGEPDQGFSADPHTHSNRFVDPFQIVDCELSFPLPVSGGAPCLQTPRWIQHSC